MILLRTFNVHRNKCRVMNNDQREIAFQLWAGEHSSMWSATAPYPARGRADPLSSIVRLSLCVPVCLASSRQRGVGSYTGLGISTPKEAGSCQSTTGLVK
ncbi:hypothetical protein AMECASPLE_006830 [Ameca splendens]|uniref:Uncharacterized protein n=1 Tax=Ameca splendens TaxID=208324 RepID=A0ABV1A5S4_9TELE